MMRHVDLCSGIGGFALGFEWAELSYPILFCDIEPWSRKVLKKHWPHVPIATDVKEIANDPDEFISGHIDILTAGYPCQPFSLAGKRRGEEDDRHIWPYIFSIIQKKRPSWTVFENVYGHITMGLDTVLTDLESEGYATRTFVIPACAVGAPHKRDRLWIISHTDRRVGDVFDSEYDGRIASEKPRGVKEAVRQESEGENYTLDFEGAGGLSRAESDVADPNDSGDRTSKCRTDKNREKKVKGWEEQSQSELGRHSENVADTHNEGVRSWERGSVSELVQEDDAGNNHQGGVGDYDGNKDGEPQIICENAKDVADTSVIGLQEHGHGTTTQSGEGGKTMADSSGSKQQGGGKGSFYGERPVSRELRRSRENSQGGWAVEPSVGRVAHGVPGRVDRLKGLGNAIVPQISYKIGVCIKEIANERS